MGRCADGFTEEGPPTLPIPPRHTMKSHNSAVLSAVLGLFVAAGTGRAAVVLSNTGQAVSDVDTVSEDHWLAAPFQTGANPSGYLFNSVTISLRGGSGMINNGGFSVAVWSNSSGVPGAVISGGSLSGVSDPSSTGLFSYTASAATLSPSTTYWVVASVPSGPGSVYQWTYAGSLAQNFSEPGWSIDGQFAYRTGSIWIAQDSLEAPFMMSIEATAVPEPAEFASIAGIAGMLVAGWMRRRRQV